MPNKLIFIKFIIENSMTESAWTIDIIKNVAGILV